MAEANLSNDYPIANFSILPEVHIRSADASGANLDEAVIGT
jgi:hypothetical protein